MNKSKSANDEIEKDLEVLEKQISQVGIEIHEIESEIQAVHDRVVSSTVSTLESVIREKIPSHQISEFRKELTELKNVLRDQIASIDSKVSTLQASSEVSEFRDEVASQMQNTINRIANVDSKVSTLQASSEVSEFRDEVASQMQSIINQIDNFNASFTSFQIAIDKTKEFSDITNTKIKKNQLILLMILAFSFIGFLMQIGRFFFIKCY